MKGYTINNSIDLLESDVEKLKSGGTGGSTTAANVSYDNTTSHLTADDVQEALDEINAKIPTIPAEKVISFTSSVEASAAEISALNAVNGTYTVKNTGVVHITASSSAQYEAGASFICNGVTFRITSYGGLTNNVSIFANAGDTITCTGLTSMSISSLYEIPLALVTPPTENTRKSKKK